MKYGLVYYIGFVDKYDTYLKNRKYRSFKSIIYFFIIILSLFYIYNSISGTPQLIFLIMTVLVFILGLPFINSLLKVTFSDLKGLWSS